MHKPKARGGDTSRLELNQAEYENLENIPERLIYPQGCSDGTSFLRNRWLMAVCFLDL